MRSLLRAGEPLFWVLGFAAITGLAVLVLSYFLSTEKICPDFLQFWTAGQLVASGQSPYSAEDQARVQRQLGWDRDKQGLRSYDFLPFYYSPWLAFTCVIFLPLGYSTAKLAWLVVNVELLLLSGYQLSRLLDGIPRWISLAAVPCFAMAILGVLIGQIAPLLLFLIVAAWRLLALGRDFWAGTVLALLLTKPQVGIVLAAALLLWSARQHRWSVLLGFALSVSILCAVSFVLLPRWPWQLAEALDQTPLVTQDSPWPSVTWLAVLRTAGAHGSVLWLLYFAAAAPGGALLLVGAWNRQMALNQVIAWAIPITFVVVPYARLYDLTILIIPLLLLLAAKRSARWSVPVFVACLVVSFLQLTWVRPSDPYRFEVSFFWMPVFLLLASLGQTLAMQFSTSTPNCPQKVTVL
jgi:hypothetical protein